MKTVTTSKGTFMFVEVPDQTCDFWLIPMRSEKGTGIFFESARRDSNHYLGNSHYIVIGQLSKITEDQAREVVDETDNPFWYGQGLKYIDYTVDDNCLETAFNSIQSLIKSEGLDPAKDYVILKINKPQ